MFTTHFKMTGQPFAERAPVDRILADDRMTQGLARLDYLADQGTLGLLTGSTGTGKSTLLKLFLHRLPPNRYRPLYLHLTRVKATGFLKLLVAALGEQPQRGKERLFLQILDRAKKSEHTALLVLDEAHHLDPDTLTDLRLLISSALDDAPPLKLLLVGQEALRDELKHNRHADLVNRISVRFHLLPLSKEQTAAYIDHQLTQAGASDKIFEPEVKNLIHDYAHGVPRLVNNLATACLIHAAIQKAQKVTEPLFHQVLPEFTLP